MSNYAAERSKHATSSSRWTKRRLRTAVPFLLAFLLLLAVRHFFVVQYSVGQDTCAYGLLPGDRVLVSRLAYVGGRSPQGQYVAFRTGTTDKSTTAIDFCVAASGDSLLIGRNRNQRRIILRRQLVGRAFCISYSIEKSYNLLPKLRAKRTFLAL